MMKTEKDIKNLVIFCAVLGTVTGFTLTVQKVFNKTGLPWVFVIVYWLVTSIFYLYLDLGNK